MTVILLIFLGCRSDGGDHWLHLRNGMIDERGEGLDECAASPDERVVAIIPGFDAPIRRLDLPRLPRAQMEAAARLAMADTLVDTSDAVHIAVGAGPSPLAAMVSDRLMADWLARLADRGLDPDLMLPETLLLPCPAEGSHVLHRDGYCLVRAPGGAFAVDSDLAPSLVPQPSISLTATDVEAALAPLLLQPPLDLRQGRHARRRRRAGTATPARLRRIAMLAAAILLGFPLLQMALLLRHDFTAVTLERKTLQVAQQALPRNERIVAPAAQLRARLATMRGGGDGFGVAGARLFQAVRDTGGVTIRTFRFGQDGTLRATIAAPDTGALSRLAAQLGATAAPPRRDAGITLTDLVIRPS